MEWGKWEGLINKERENNPMTNESEWNKKEGMIAQKVSDERADWRWRIYFSSVTNMVKEDTEKTEKRDIDYSE